VTELRGERGGRGAAGDTVVGKSDRCGLLDGILHGKRRSAGYHRAALESVRLFVYGSLKRGGAHHEELRGSTFLAEARTIPGFELVTLELEQISYRALVPAPGKPSSVPGEVFEVPAELLPALDEFEGEGQEYERRPVPLAEIALTGVLAYFKKSR
jgi:gamma-glutamylcyclotransferase (GGCT)/AIG2-like uncharacterized protein YtfP